MWVLRPSGRNPDQQCRTGVQDRSERRDRNNHLSKKERFGVETPWGLHELEVGITEIGREVGPFTDYLQAYLTVSRRHASLRVMVPNGRRRRLFVTDHDSTNRTYINGHPLDPNEPAELKYGDVVALSTKVALRVQEVGE